MFHYLTQRKLKMYLEQECILVGYVPPLRYRMRGLPDRDSVIHGQRPPGQRTPPSPVNRIICSYENIIIHAAISLRNYVYLFQSASLVFFSPQILFKLQGCLSCALN